MSIYSGISGLQKQKELERLARLAAEDGMDLDVSGLPRTPSGRVQREAAALLRTMAGENPFDTGLTRLVGELSTRSDHFRTLWAAHDVRLHRTGTKRFNHPLAGELTLAYEGMELTADPGLRLNAYVAEPGTASADAFALLASWAATPHQLAAATTDVGE